MVTVTLTAISIVKKISAATGGSVVDPNGGGQVTIPANALLTPDGKKYSGDAEISIAVVDTSSMVGRDSVPGLTGV